MKRLRWPPYSFSPGKTQSIPGKYNTSFLAFLFLLIAVFLFSFTSSALMKTRYESAMNALLDINELFINVENTNAALYNYLLYVPLGSLEGFQSEADTARKSTDRILSSATSARSRDIVDLCMLVYTYLDQSSHLMEQRETEKSQGMQSDQTDLDAMYAESQKIISFINARFKDIYSDKLDSTMQLEAALDKQYRTFSFIGITLLLIGALLFSFIRHMTHGISNSIKSLTTYATMVSQNHKSEHRVRLRTNDEVEILAHAFNEMMDTIQLQFRQIEEHASLKEKMQRIELENLRIGSALQSSQLKLLQSRINPHFLFNTLNMITQTAYMEDAEETAHLMEATAELLRYNLGKVTKSVTMEEELLNLKNYVFLQERRYGKRMAFQFDIDPSCGILKVPCLIIQPLVENAITHGVGFMTNGARIHVRIYRKNDTIALEVRDNGVGMDANKLQQLNLSLASGEIRDDHIGLRNVSMRLNLFFGCTIPFHLESRPGETIVYIHLPSD